MQYRVGGTIKQPSDIGFVPCLKAVFVFEIL